MANKLLDSLVEIRGSYFFPRYDLITHQYLNENGRLDEPHKISQFCKNKRVCVQAGGNVGVYPILFSKFFEQVITFEPDKLNFDCIELNLEKHGIHNVSRYNAAIGNETRRVKLKTDPSNCGAGHLGKDIEEGETLMMKIDNLNLDNLDLLALDVEGFEVEALSGAIETIKRYSPVICAEIGWSDCSTFLEKLGYSKVATIDVNYVFIKSTSCVI